MTYRDDLEQSHARIAKLENELAEARAAGPQPRRTIPLLVGILVSVAAVSALVLFVHARSSAEPSPIVVRWVDDVARTRPVGEHLRVRGSLVHGSEKRRHDGDACALDFVLEHGGALLSVHHDDCILPDFFGREPYWVIGDGALQSDGTFLAKDVLVAFRDEMR